MISLATATRSYQDAAPVSSASSKLPIIVSRRQRARFSSNRGTVSQGGSPANLQQLDIFATEDLTDASSAVEPTQVQPIVASVVALPTSVGVFDPTSFTDGIVERPFWIAAGIAALFALAWLGV